jgi:thiosulfate reductase cytochrome b subunit
MQIKIKKWLLDQEAKLNDRQRFRWLLFLYGLLLILCGLLILKTYQTVPYLVQP